MIDDIKKDIKLVILGEGGQAPVQSQNTTLSSSPKKDIPLFTNFSHYPDPPLYYGNNNFDNLFNNQIASWEEENYLEDLGSSNTNSDFQKTEKNWDPPVFIAIPPQLCGDCYAYNGLAKRLKEKELPIEVYGVDDSKIGRDSNRSIDELANRYLHLLIEEFDFLLSSPPLNQPKKQLILLAYSSAFPVALTMVLKLNEMTKSLNHEMNDVIKIISLDPTPKNYFKKDSRDLAELLLQVIRTYNKNRLKMKVMLERPFWKAEDLKLIEEELSTILPQLSVGPQNAVLNYLTEQVTNFSTDTAPLKAFFEKATIVNLISKLCDDYYKIPDSKLFKEDITNIIVNFLALYQWHAYKNDDPGILKVCKETTMVTAEQSVTDQQSVSNSMQWEVMSLACVSDANHLNLLSMFSQETAERVYIDWLKFQQKQLLTFLETDRNDDSKEQYWETNQKVEELLKKLEAKSNNADNSLLTLQELVDSYQRALDKEIEMRRARDNAAKESKSSAKVQPSRAIGRQLSPQSFSPPIKVMLKRNKWGADFINLQNNNVIPQNNTSQTKDIPSGTPMFSRKKY